MGNTTSSEKIKCEICHITYGSTAILNVSDSGNLGGHHFCVNCYPSANEYKFTNNYFKKMKCEWCSYKTDNESTLPVFKIYWYGKFGGHKMCEKCLYNKDYRNNKNRK